MLCSAAFFRIRSEVVRRLRFFVFRRFACLSFSLIGFLFLFPLPEEGGSTQAGGVINEGSPSSPSSSLHPARELMEGGGEAGEATEVGKDEAKASRVVREVRTDEGVEEVEEQDKLLDLPS
jgi:hypothetical protein